MDTNKFKIIKLDQNYIQLIEVIWKSLCRVISNQ